MTDKKKYDFDPIAVRNALIKMYNPQKYPEPYNKDGFEFDYALGENKRNSLFRVFKDLPNDQAIRLWEASDSLAEIRREASRFKALERVYLGPFEDPKYEKEKYFFTRLMLENIKNSLATRNRKRIIKRELMNFVKSKKTHGDTPITVLSIGAGSARAIIEGAGSLKKDGFSLNLRLVDHDSEAIKAAELLAKENSIQYSLKSIEANFYEIRKYLKEGQYVDFVEIVGLLDYLNDRTVRFLLSCVREFMRDNGLILFSNVVPNDEQEFLHNIIGWPQMKYREGRQVQGFARDTGFINSEFIPEPTGFISLIKARK